MQSTSRAGSTTLRSALAVSLVLGALAAGVFAVGTSGLGFSSARAEDAKPAATPPKDFASKEDAAKALIEAAAKNDDAALGVLCGSGSADVIQSGTDPQVAKDRAAFAAAAQKKLAYEEKDGSITLVVGDEEWPFPIPLVKQGSFWRFDAAEGRDEILARRIGRGELRAIKTCRDFAAAQVEYASKDWDGDKVREYAQRLISTPGAHDGLYWPAAEGGAPSPLADELSAFKDFLASPGAAAPFQGYVWRILVAQGSHAPGGAYSYIINGNMIAGFALIGVPSSYRNTGITTVMVSNHGTIYQKDLGAGTLDAAKAIVSFDPDETWSEVDAADLAASAN